MYGIRSPLIPLVLAYAVGIVSSSILGHSLIVPSLLFSFFAFGLLLFLLKDPPFHHRYFPSLLLLLAWSSFGFLARSWENGQDSWVGGKSEKWDHSPHPVRILKPEGQGGGELRFKGRSGITGQPLLLQIERGEKARELLPGDRILSEPSPERIAAPLDTAEFDRREFYASKGVHRELELRASQFGILEKGWVWSEPFTLALRLREICFRALKGLHSLEGEELSVASALWLGRKTDLPDELRKDYADAGGMHVLAVSGLHVGIFYLMLRTFTWPLRRWRFGKKARPSLILFTMWSYAALTGWSASVVRAVLMFSLYTLGQGLRRPPPVSNVIAGSAMIVLLFRPSMLEEIGFLLSYSAVIAIVALYPSIEGCFNPPWRPLRWLWSLLAVSVAAQVGVLPIVLFAFGKFPLWFLLTNPILLPLATLALYSGIPMIISFLIPGAAEWTGWAAGWVFGTMNAWVGWIAERPGSGLELGPITAPTACLLALVLGTCILYIHRYSILPSWLLYAPCSLLIGFLIVKEFQVRDEHAIIHHAWPDKAVTSIRKGKEVRVLSSGPLREYRKARLQNFWKERGVEKVRMEVLQDRTARSMLFEHSGWEILYWNGPKREALPLPGEDERELVVIGKEAPPPDASPRSVLQCERILIRNERHRNAWKERARREGIDLHIIPEDGAYVASL